MKKLILILLFSIFATLGNASYLINPYQVAVAGGAYSPLNVAGLSFLYDSEPSGVILSGSDVSTWIDQSPNGWDLYQGTQSLMPAYGVFDGNDSLYFDFAPYMINPSVNITPACTFVWVMYDKNNFTTCYLWDTDDPAGANRNFVRHTSSTSNYLISAGSLQSTTTTKNHLVKQITVLNENGGGVDEIWSNGVKHTFPSAGTTGLIEGITFGAAYGVGSTNFAYFYFFAGWDRALTDTEVDALNVYLSDRFGVPLEN